MSQIASSYAVWLADYYLLSTALLALALVGIVLLKQPAQRLAVAKSTLVSLMLLGVLCAVPGWSVLHLLTTERPQPMAESHRAEFSAAPAVVAERTRPIEIGAATAAKKAQVPPPNDTRPTPSIAQRISWPVAFVVTHLAGAAGIAAWLLLGLVASSRLRRTAQPASPHVVAILNEVTRPNHPQWERVQLLTHERIDVAVALGIRRPIILLPAQWTQRESLEHLRAVLAHESTHILNRDLQWVAVARALFVALWANPLFWIIRRCLRLDQEALADAAAAELTSRQRYAEQLVAWARDVRSRPAMHLSSPVGLWEGPSQLRQRISILLNEQLTVLRNCSRRWRLASIALCAVAAVALSLVTLRPGQSAPPADEKQELSNSDREKVAAAIKVLRETKGTGAKIVGNTYVADEWPRAIQTLAQIGKPAAPAVIDALDHETRDDAISKLAFALRAIGDPRAVPALIRAIPRTLIADGGDYGLSAQDPELLKFMQDNDIQGDLAKFFQNNDARPNARRNDFHYGRAFPEVVGALHKLTGANQKDEELFLVLLGESEQQRRIGRKLFHDLAERWAKWWAENRQSLGVGEQYAAVNLEPLKDSKAVATARLDALPRGPKLGLTQSGNGWIVQSAHESKKHCFVDLDTWRWAGWPRELPSIDKIGQDQQPILKWADEQGFDVMGITYQPPEYDAPLYCLQPLHMKVWQLTPVEQWTLPKAIKGEIPYPLNHPVDRMVPGKEKYNGPYAKELGGTAFLFLTREGTAGLLRLTAQATDTNVPLGKPHTDDDQYSPVGFNRGVKISVAMIAEAENPDGPKEEPAGDESESKVQSPADAKEAIKSGNDEKPPVAAKTEDTSGDDHAPTGGVTITVKPQPGTPNTIAGQCVDENGKPLANVNVVLCERLDCGWKIWSAGGVTKGLAYFPPNLEGASWLAASRTCH